MRLITILIAGLSAVGVMADLGMTCGDLSNQESLASCVAVPVSTICPASGASEMPCVCSQLSYQANCESSYCSGSVNTSLQSFMSTYCTGGAGGAAAAATTTAGSSSVTATAGSGGSSAATPAATSATKNAAMGGMANAPFVEILVIVAVAVAAL